jgi:uncharacterized lipoprotein YajG
MLMKTIKRLITHSLCILLASVLCVGCVEPSDTYDSGQYKNFATMLNQCQGTTVVIAIGEMSGTVSYAEVSIVVIDSTNTCFGCAIGGDLGLQIGDTLKWAGNAR